MKKLFLTIIIVAAGLIARADEYPYLVFQTTDGNNTTMSVESLSMTISNGQLVVTNNSETKTFTLTELNKMYFSEDFVGINEIFTTDNGEVDVYSVMGIHIGKFDNANEAVNALNAGVYLLKTKSNTVKISVR